MKPIIPTIFAHNKKEFTQRFNKLLRISKNLQIDFMDGKFVKGKSVTLAQIPNLRKYPNNFEAHLMIQNPKTWIPKLKQKGFKKIIFHIESKNPNGTLNKIKKLKLSPWIAINPQTSLEKLKPFLTQVKGILFMGINPGKEHQTLKLQVIKKIKQLHKQNPKIKIQVDGGVNLKTAKKLAKAGVNYINSGSYISNTEKPKEAFNNLNDLFKKC